MCGVVAASRMGVCASADHPSCATQAKDAEIEALKEHIRKTQTFKLPGIDSDSVTNPYGMSMVDPTERGTQTTINMGNMDSMSVPCSAWRAATRCLHAHP